MYEALRKENEKLKASNRSISQGGQPNDFVDDGNLRDKLRKIEKDNILLRCERVPVVRYNKDQSTYEYLAEPIVLDQDKPLTDIESILTAMKLWL